LFAFGFFLLLTALSIRYSSTISSPSGFVHSLLTPYKTCRLTVLPWLVELYVVSISRGAPRHDGWISRWLSSYFRLYYCLGTTIDIDITNSNFFKLGNSPNLTLPKLSSSRIL
jgi:hypothetical protein